MVAHSPVMLGNEYLNGVISGEYHTFLKTSSGRYLALGENMFGQAGVGYYSGWSGTSVLSTPVEIVLPGVKIYDLSACGNFNSATGILITDGCTYELPNIRRPNTPSCFTSSLFGMGSNDAGQLGNSTSTGGTSVTAVNVTDILNNQRIIHMTSGQGFTVAMSSTGQLFSWGNNTLCI
jgi:alpha-tubulin suppressor-like RCC1 family protein